MNPRQHRINFQDLAILRGSLIPLSLQFQRLRIQFMNLERKGSFVRQVLRRSQGEIGVSVSRRIESLGIAREFTAKDGRENRATRRESLRHGAMDAVECRCAFLSPGLRFGESLSSITERLGAMPAFSKTSGVLRGWRQLEAGLAEFVLPQEE